MRIVRTAVAVGVLAVLAAGCSSGGDATTASSVSGLACDDAAVTPAITAALGKDESLRHVNGLTCQDGWAVAFPTVGPADGSADGEIDITLVFKGVDGKWVEQDRAAVCGTSPTGDGSPAYPSDSQVPQALWRGACQTN